MRRVRWALVCIFAVCLLASSACSKPSTGGAQLANPAAVHCRDQGYEMEIRTDGAGGQYGVCVFPDGSECDAWAYYRGECGPGDEPAPSTEGAPATNGAPSTDGGSGDSPVITPPPSPVITPAPSPLEPATVNVAQQAGLADTVAVDILEASPNALESHALRLTITDPEIVRQMVGALDGPIVLGPRVRCPAWYVLRFQMGDGSVQEFGLACDAEDPAFLRGGQDFWQGRDGPTPAAVATLIREQLAATPPQTPVVGWQGRVVALPEGSQYDDYLALAPEGAGEFGLAGADEAVEAQIVALRDEDAYAHFWGTLTCHVPDHGGCRLDVTRVRVDEGGPPAAADPVEGWEGVVISNPPMSEFDDHFVLLGDFLVLYGIESADPEVTTQLESLRDTLTPIRIWGQVTCGVPDTNGCQIQVTRVEVTGEPLAPGEAD